MNQTRGRYHQKVFSHEFAGFKGVRQAQSILHSDHRFVTTCLNITGGTRTIATRLGAVQETTDLFGTISAAAADQEQRILGVGDSVWMEEL